jgi:hypothetical protein
VASEVIVTRGFALAWFGSETAAVGRTIVVSRESMPIVGVLAHSPPLPWRTGIELFTPHRTPTEPFRHDKRRDRRS